jgi:hypothetical protein
MMENNRYFTKKRSKDNGRIEKGKEEIEAISKFKGQT